MLLKSTVATVFWTGTIFLAATGLLRQDNGSVVEATAVWAGIVGGIGTAMWGFVQIEFQRADKGLRADGLPSLLLVAVPLSALIQLGGTMLWPFVVKEPVGSLVTELHSDPTAVLQVALFVVAVMAWSMTGMFGFARGGPRLGILSGVLLLATLGLGAWQAIVLFEQPVDPSRTALWAVLAVLGLAAMTLVAVLTRKAGQEARAEMHRLYGKP